METKTPKLLSVADWLNRNPGWHSAKEIAMATGFSTGSVALALQYANGYQVKKRRRDERKRKSVLEYHSAKLLREAG